MLRLANRLPTSSASRRAKGLTVAVRDQLIFATAVEGRYIALNQAWEDALGLPMAELLRTPRSAFLHPDDLALANEWRLKVLEDRDVPPIRTRLRHPDRGYRTYEWEAVPLAGFRIILGTGRPVESADVPTLLSVRDGQVEIDTVPRVARVCGRTVDLTALEFDFLRLLIEMRGTVLHADQIAGAVWGYEQAGCRNFLQAHVSRLRKKLRQAGVDDLIETVRGVGYVIR